MGLMQSVGLHPDHLHHLAATGDKFCQGAVQQHPYSVPFRLLRQEVEARITAKTVEIFHRGKLVATHLRNLRPYRPTTVDEHMPSSHRRCRDWTHERIQREATIGSDTAALVEIVLRSRPHLEQGFRSCIGILGLRKRYSAERLDAACAKALTLGISVLYRRAPCLFADDGSWRGAAGAPDEKPGAHSPADYRRLGA